MHTSIESKTAPSGSPSGVNHRRQGMISLATQSLLLLALGITVLGALLCDSRLYYGINVDGRPLYQEHPLSHGSTLDTNADG